MAGRVRVFIASSLDGFIAGPDDALDWLPNPSPDHALPEGVLGFEDFLRDVGAMLMGRRTYDVVQTLGAWPYGELPVLVVTHRPLTPVAPTVRAVAGDIHALLDEALRVADGRDVYVDGGGIVRAAMDAGRVDDLVITLAPVVLGAGVPLFAGVARPHRLEILSHRDYGGGMVQLHARPR
ncbi:MAG: dihydrofolate reductase family protein [Polyangiales bacterium]